MRKYELIVFDLIDTLAYCKGLSDVETELVQAVGQDTVDSFIDGGNIDKKKTVDEAMEKFKTSAHLTEEQEALTRKWLSWSNSYLFEDTVEILEYLKVQGYRVGIISNSPPTNDDQLADLGIAHYVEVAVFSYELGLRKPEKEIFIELLERVNVESSQALMIGDSLENDVNGALAVGMDALLLDRNNNSNFNSKITSLLLLKGFLST